MCECACGSCGVMCACVHACIHPDVLASVHDTCILICVCQMYTCIQMYIHTKMQIDFSLSLSSSLSFIFSLFLFLFLSLSLSLSLSVYGFTCMYTHTCMFFGLFVWVWMYAHKGGREAIFHLRAHEHKNASTYTQIHTYPQTQADTFICTHTYTY